LDPTTRQRSVFKTTSSWLIGQSTQNISYWGMVLFSNFNSFY